jgi:VanZ family protein
MRWLRRWWPVAAWAVLIFFFSTDTFSATHTSRLILPVLRWLFPHASPETLETAHFLIRKSAHFVEYFIFSLLALHALRGEEGRWKLRWALEAAVLAGAYAALDEFHQSFVPSRTASVYDVLLDTFGAVVAQALAAWRALAGGAARGQRA